jgi:hypothetical protein
MAFQRNHVSDAERMAIGLHVFQDKSMYGLITDLARQYLVSRWLLLLFSISSSAGYSEGEPGVAQTSIRVLSES